MLVDFHSHYYDPAWLPGETPRGFSAAMQRAWPLLTDIGAQLAAMDAAGVDTKVMSAPLSTLAAPGAEPPTDLAPRMNERFAALVAAHPGRLRALATIDAFGGDTAAREVERAITGLGLGGVCVDCTRGERYLDAPEARPTFAACAALGVPVFVHPASPPGYTERLGRHGQVGILMARGAEAAASVLGMIRSGVFAALPTLTVVLPMMSASVLLFAGLMDIEQRRDESEETPPRSAAFNRLCVDTMGLHPRTIRFAVDYLGPEQVLVGSDWPIMPIPTRAWVEEALRAAGITAANRALLMYGNADRLLYTR